MAKTVVFGRSIAELDRIIANLEGEVFDQKVSTISPSDSKSATSQSAPAPSTDSAASSSSAGPSTATPANPAKASKKEKRPPPPSGTQTPQDAFSKIHLQVAQVVACDRHPSADTLYVCSVNLGSEKRQVVTGLVAHYSADDLKNRLVVVITNLRPSKLRGVDSNAMLLAADDTLTTKQNRVILLQPPAGAAVGDRVYLEGTTPEEEIPPRINPKQWEKIVAGLFVKQGGKATFKDIPLVTKDGSVTVSGIADDSGIH